MKILTRSTAPKATGRLIDDFVEFQPPPPPKKETPVMKSLLTNTGLQYLNHGVHKLADDLHPNFARAISSRPKYLATVLRVQRAVRRALVSASGSPRLVVIHALREVKDDVACYVQLLKDVLANAAFAAHMDVSALQRHMNPDAADAALDAMGEAHVIEDDVPVYDIAQTPDRDPDLYEGVNSIPEQVIATSIEDAYEAINGVQAFLDLGTLALNDDQRDYWGLATTTPFGQRVDTDDWGEKIYTPLLSFDDYREWQRESWSRKRRTVRVDPTAEQLMTEA